MSENTQKVLTLAEEIEALQAKINDRKTQMVKVGQPFIEALFEANTVQPPKAGSDSTWVGFVQTDLVFEVNGAEHHVKVVVTDVKASDTLKAAKAKATKEARELEALQKKHGDLLAKLQAAQPAAS